GITETKIYDRQAVIDRYGIAPEVIPDFYGLKGDTSDNIPGVPGIGDKTASELIANYGSLEQVLVSVEQVSGPKRKQALVEHAEDARLSKRLATIQRDVEVDFDIAAEAVRAPDRSRIREVFREYELRDPLRRLEEARPASEPRGGGEERAEVLVGECAGPEELVAACGERPVVAHDAKALRLVPANLAHDTLLGAYLLDPARRGYPFAELCEERGLASAIEDPLGGEAVMLG